MAAATRTFSSPATLSLDEPSTPQAPSLEGRRRLPGAFFIEIERIAPDPEQPRKRIDSGAQRELDLCVKQMGILQPITVCFVPEDNVYRIITGERRYEAAKHAGLKEIPCWVQTPGEKDFLLHQVVENWLRADMHPYDLADTLARLRDANGYTQKRLAQETGKSEAEISKLLALLDLDPAVQKIARDANTGSLGRRHLYPLTKLRPADQRRVVQQVQNERLTAAQVEVLARSIRRTGEEPKKRGAPVKHFRFPTGAATVTVTFRKKDISTAEVATALDEARAQLGEP